MKTVNVSGLKNNPSEALRQAQRDMVVVMNRDRPVAMMAGVESTGLLNKGGVKRALATALFRDGSLSLGRAARLAGCPVGEFVAHLSRLGIPVVKLDEDEARQDMDTLEAWLASS